MPSGFADLTPVDRQRVSIEDDFWSPRIATIRETTLDFVYQHLVDSGRVENLRIAAGERDGEFNGRFYNDSDVYKWLEAACYFLPDAASGDGLRDRVDEIVTLIAAAQEDDGYLNTYFQIVEPEKKWTNLHKMHELYCAGHLFEAAVAHHEATGTDTLLDVATDFADHIDDRFGPEPEKDDGIPGHEEIELALVRLYRATDEERYLSLARYFVDTRGQEDSPLRAEIENPEGRAGDAMQWVIDEEGNYDGTYLQDHAPVRDQETAEGHAVRATYLYSGMADLAMETGDRDLYEALERLWENMTTKRMYVTGGIGSTHEGERFTEDYDLPNRTSYAETCAALGSILWNRRMFQLTGEPRFGDVLERTLYNGLLAGISLDGSRFFYANPLEMGPEGHPLHDVDPNRFNSQRQGWFDTACCPTNVPRLLASLGRYAYFTDGEGVHINLHLGSEADLTVNGTPVQLAQETGFPWEAETTVSVSPEEPTAFPVHLRVPAWCDEPTVTVNGDPIPVDGGSVTVARTWRDGDEITFSATFPVEVIRAHPRVASTSGRVALRRGPIVYCVEGQDSPRPLHQIEFDPDGEFRTTRDRDLLDEVTVIEGEASVPALDGWEDELYRSADGTDETSVAVRAIPYYGWGHRGDDEMRVWVRSTS